MEQRPEPRFQIEANEERLAAYAAKSKSAARREPEEPCPFRAAFQRDRDRIIHCKAFRRLAHKTQVFLNPTGDHYRSRLTHTLEVAQIARTLARALNLNEDLAEAAALGHDLGHTPFGHSGERALAALAGGFRHNAQSLRVVDVLAKDGGGLNLTDAVRDGIIKHSKGRGPIFIEGEKAPRTYEGLLVRVADLVAYLAHDLDDAQRSGLISPADLPPELLRAFGLKPSISIGAMVADLLSASEVSETKLGLRFSPDMERDMGELRNFLHVNVYASPKLLDANRRSEAIIAKLYDFFVRDPETLHLLEPESEKFPLPDAVCDFISGMTDRYAIRLWKRISQNSFDPADFQLGDWDGV